MHIRDLFFCGNWLGAKRLVPWEQEAKCECRDSEIHLQRRAGPDERADGIPRVLWKEATVTITPLSSMQGARHRVGALPFSDFAAFLGTTAPSDSSPGHGASAAALRHHGAGAIRTQRSLPCSALTRASCTRSCRCSRCNAQFMKDATHVGPECRVMPIEGGRMLCASRGCGLFSRREQGLDDLAAVTIKAANVFRPLATGSYRRVPPMRRTSCLARSFFRS